MAKKPIPAGIQVIANIKYAVEYCSEVSNLKYRNNTTIEQTEDNITKLTITAWMHNRPREISLSFRMCKMCNVKIKILAI